MKRLWLVRLGKKREHEQLALQRSILTVDFGVAANLSAANSRKLMLSLVRIHMPGETKARQGNVMGQLHRFVNEIAVGDIVVSPFKASSSFGISEVCSEYEPLNDGRPSRRVKWLAPSVERNAFDQDLLYSFGALLTVCAINRSAGVQRVLTIAKLGSDPGAHAFAKDSVGDDVDD